MSAMRLKPWLIRSRMLWIVNLTLASIILSAYAGLGCPIAPDTLLGEIMVTETAWIGQWERVTFSPCSRTYPTQIEFHKNGLYRGIGAQSGPSLGWDVGTYNIVSSSQVRISAANDTVLTYKYAIANDRLTFVDPDGCEFQYQKVGQQLKEISF